MTGIAETLVRVAARSLPERVRDRYREEWSADLAGAADAGVSRSSVVIGAFRTASTMSRIAPEVTGHTLSRLFVHRLRVAGGLLGGAAVLATGYLAYGGYANPQLGDGVAAVSALAVIVVAVIGVLGAAGTVALAGAVRVAVAARRPVVAALLVGIPVLLAAGALAAPSLLLGVGMLAGPMSLIALAVFVVLGARGRSTLPVAGRLGLAAAFAAVALAACAVGILHIAVWNPLARVPGLTLDEIYARLDAAREAMAVSGWLSAWGVVTVLGAIAYLVVAVAWRTASTRRIVALGFLLIAATTALGFAPAFSMGMGLADTFMTSGGDAAASGPLLAISGQAALVAAILTAAVRPPTPLPPPVAAQLARP